jgi:hypothetical protein
MFFLTNGSGYVTILSLVRSAPFRPLWKPTPPSRPTCFLTGVGFKVSGGVPGARPGTRTTLLGLIRGGPLRIIYGHEDHQALVLGLKAVVFFFDMYPGIAFHIKKLTFD